jgi:hypothetical protein
MANHTVSILIRFRDGNRRRTVAVAYAGKARLKPGVGLVDGRERPCEGGIYWLRWYNGSKQIWKRIGSDSHGALIGQIRQEAILAGETVPIPEPKSASRVIMVDAIEILSWGGSNTPRRKSPQEDKVALGTFLFCHQQNVFG